MTHRPKLSLSPDAEVAKKPVPGFGPEDGEVAAAEAAPGPPTTSVDAPSETPRQAASGAERAPLAPAKGPSGIEGRRILKVLLVGAAAVLAVYLLKRRFM